MAYFKMRSITGRVRVGKLLGLTIGLLVLVTLPIFGFPIDSMLGWGLLVMFSLMGAMIGLMGIYDTHPILGYRLYWWMRGPLVGMAFMLMFILLSYDEIQLIMQSSLLAWLPLESPFWVLVDGAVIGGCMGYLCTKIAGEGPVLPIK